MSGSPRSRLRMPHWGWWLLGTVALVVAGIGLSVWLPYHREQQAIQKIKSWPGVVETTTVGPGWLRQLVGNDRVHQMKVFERIISVQCRLPGRKNRTSSPRLHVTDADLIHLSGLRQLEHLFLDETHVSDTGLAHLTGSTSLKLLSLKGTAVNGSGLASLRG